jgi:hypothetical protein
MPKTTWLFTITFNVEDPLQTKSTGICAASAEDVDYFGEVSGLKVEGYSSPQTGVRKALKVSEDESSESLARLLKGKRHSEPLPMLIDSSQAARGCCRGSFPATAAGVTSLI